MAGRRQQPEHYLQASLVSWAALASNRWPQLGLLYAIPNGGSRRIQEAKRLKAEGVRSGVPDLHLPVARGGYFGLWLETKVEELEPTEKGVRKRRTYQSPEQRAWAESLQREGHRVVVYRTLDEGTQALTDYLALDATAR